MCGIVGVVSPAEVDPELVARMRDRLAHRGPDAAGLWRSDDGRVCLGHRRLSVIDPSPAANQPFVSSDGRFVITYNGELYNFKLLRSELVRLGAEFHTSSDTEVLLEAFRAWGDACLERLSGMFAFAIWDVREQRLFCARDRAGEKPFHYASINGTFIFASELKSLLLCPGFDARLDYEALGQFFVLGCVADPKTIWRGARKLEPAHALSVDLRGTGASVLAPHRYWDLSFRPDTSVSDWRPLIRETLERTVAEMAFADVPVGAFLSGGVDSSAITAALRRTGRSVSTFTIGFDEDGFDEREWALRVARLYETTHTERVLRPEDVTSAFPDTVMWHYDEPFNDHSYLPVYAVSKAARESITVALSGDGGDELFAGYNRYLDLARYSQAGGPAADFSWAGLGSSGPTTFATPSRGVRTLKRLGRRLSGHTRTASLVAPKGALLGTISSCIPEARLRTVARGPLARALEGFSPVDVVRAHLRRAPPEEVGLVNARRYLDLKLTLGSDLLVKVDRASMAVSLEVRPVFLHRDFLDLVGRIPEPELNDGVQSKKVLKAALEPWLPADLLYRKKAGFSMPLGGWLRGELSTLLEGMGAGDRPLAEVISPAFVEAEVQRHLLGRSDGHAPMLLHGLLHLDHWLERWA